MNPFRRALGKVVVAALLLGVALSPSARAADKQSDPKASEYFVYFGTYTKAKSKGIYRARLDVATGKLSAAELAAECKDPAFLAVHPTEKFLYAIDESTDPARTPNRGVSAYAIEARTGALTLLNEQSAAGAGPCHLAVDHRGTCVLVANYSGGSVVALPLSVDGRLGAPGAPIKHVGSSVHPGRQKQPHAHAITLAPDSRFALSPDLGIDKVMVYRVDAARAALTPNTPAFATLPPGSGPRHLAFNPNGKFVYVINELLCTIAVFSYDASSGALKDVQTISTLPPGESVQPGYSTAEIATHPSGRFVFGSNRGHDSVVVFAADAVTGRLTYVENKPTGGKTPRHFAVDPSGKWLLAENQGSDSVVVFAIDAKSGRLTPTGQSIEVAAPVCAVFVRAR
jgi:6-phosphogluconolactonase